MVTNSLVVFVVRDGNPKKIYSWDDLVRPGVQVVTPNPFTSGGARWNVMAAYGAQRKLGKTDRQAQAYLLKLFKHVVAQDKSARDSLQTFNAGRATSCSPTRTRRSSRARRPGPVRDPALDDPDREPDRRHEDERAQGRGERVPPLPAHARRAAGLRRERLPAGRSRACSRSSSRSSSRRGRGQFTIDELGLGGWAKVQKRFFDPSSGIMARIERQVGGARADA